MNIRSIVEQSRKILTTDWRVPTIGMFFGLSAVLAGAKPTGSTLVDILYVCLAVFFVILVGSNAEWWAISLYVAVSAAVAFSPVGIAVGLVLYLVTFLSTSRGESSRWIKAVVIGI